MPRVVPCFPLLGLTPSGLFMGLSSTIIYTSELILCSTICVPSATRQNIHINTGIARFALIAVSVFFEVYEKYSDPRTSGEHAPFIINNYSPKWG